MKLVEKLFDFIYQLRCDHPEYAMEARFRMLPEENGMDIYMRCMNCGKEFPEMRIN